MEREVHRRRQKDWTFPCHKRTDSDFQRCISSESGPGFYGTPSKPSSWLCFQPPTRFDDLVGALPSPVHCGPEQKRIQTAVLGHSLACLLAPPFSLRWRAPLRSTELTRLLVHSLCSLPRSWDSEWIFCLCFWLFCLCFFLFCTIMWWCPPIGGNGTGELAIWWELVNVTW